MLKHESWFSFSGSREAIQSRRDALKRADTEAARAEEKKRLAEEAQAAHERAVISETRYAEACARNAASPALYQEFWLASKKDRGEIALQYAKARGIVDSNKLGFDQALWNTAFAELCDIANCPVSFRETYRKIRMELMEREKL